MIATARFVRGEPGALLTEHDATAATVRAVLDAINRRLVQVL